MNPEISLEDRATCHFQPLMAGSEATETVASSQSAKPAADYPLEGLGEILGAVAVEIQQEVQCSSVIVGQSLLAASALAAQGHADVVIDGRVIPLSLNCLTIAESGERKSAVDKIVLGPVHDVQREWVESHKQEMMNHEIEMEAYKKAKLTILNEHKGADQQTIVANLGGLRHPEAPVEPTIISQDPTIEGLAKSMRFGKKSQGLFSDEGGLLLGGFGMQADNLYKTLAGFSKFWDGDPITRTRAGQGESFTLYGTRLSSHLMVQPVVRDKFLNDSALMEQGFLARFLIAEADVRAGRRFYRTHNCRLTSAFTVYASRMRALLTSGMNVNPDFERKTLILSADAKRCWVGAYNAIEKELGVGHELEAIKPVAAKMAENILRIAGIRAVLEGLPEIGLGHMEESVLLGSFYLQQALEFSRRAEADPVEERAQLLLEWIKGFPNKTVTADDNTSAPASTKVKGNIKEARKLLARLVDSEKVVVTRRNTKDDPCEWRAINV